MEPAPRRTGSRRRCRATWDSHSPEGPRQHTHSSEGARSWTTQGQNARRSRRARHPIQDSGARLRFPPPDEEDLARAGRARQAAPGEEPPPEGRRFSTPSVTDEACPANGARQCRRRGPRHAPARASRPCSRGVRGPWHGTADSVRPPPRPGGRRGSAAQDLQHRQARGRGKILGLDDLPKNRSRIPFQHENRTASRRVELFGSLTRSEQERPVPRPMKAYLGRLWWEGNVTLRGTSLGFSAKGWVERRSEWSASRFQALGLLESTGISDPKGHTVPLPPWLVALLAHPLPSLLMNATLVTVLRPARSTSLVPHQGMAER